MIDLLIIRTIYPEIGFAPAKLGIAFIKSVVIFCNVNISLFITFLILERRVHTIYNRLQIGRFYIPIISVI